MYNWSPINTKAIISVNPNSWIMSFWIALSKRRIKGIISSSTSINKKIFRWFLDDLWSKLRRDDSDAKTTCFIFDNSSVNWNDETANYMWQTGFRWISIPPYSPQLNVCEKITAPIKTKLNSHWIRNKPLNLSIMKKIVDEINENVCKGWVDSVKVEIYQKLKYFNNEV